MAINTVAVVASELVTATKWNTMRNDLLYLDGKLIGWTPYTPAVLSGTGWALGTTGSNADGAYCVTNSVVHFWSQVEFGTTGATFGAASPILTLPMAPNASVYDPFNSIRTICTDASTGTHFDGIGQISGPNALVLGRVTSGAYSSVSNLSSALPFTWAAGDIIRMSGWYRKA